jgi:Ca2+-binding RTX toxin-like protein
VLLGGPGHDVLISRRGRNFLIGGGGHDVLLGGCGQDILVRGRTAFDASDAALAAITAEWTSTRRFAARVANLSGTGPGPRRNGDVFLRKGETVFDDGAWDSFLSGSGRNWLVN